MSDPTQEHRNEAVSEAPVEQTPPVAPPAPVRPRIWPALIIVAVHLVALIVTQSLSAVIANGVVIVGFPILSVILLAIWWLGFSRVPWRDRFAGLAVFAAVAAWTVISQPQYRQYIHSVSLPVLSMGTVLILAATKFRPWRERRRKALIFLMACAVLFPMVRVEDFGSNLAPNLTWRWSPRPEERYEATRTAANPGGRADLPEKPGPQDWPGFRGPRRDGIVRGVTIATDWGERPPKEIWRKPVGLGFSSFAAIGKYIFTQEQRLDSEVVVCYDAGTGDEVWVNSLPVRFDEASGDGPRATPSFDNGKLYAQSALGKLQCLDASTGAAIWTADTVADTDAKVPQWGIVSSPLVTEKLVVAFTGGANDKAVVAYDKTNGSKVWCGGASAPGYSSAQYALIGGVPQIVMASGFGVQAFAPATGAILWQNEWRTSMNPRVVQPTIIDEKAVLVGTAEGKGTRYLDVVQTDAGWKATEKWTSGAFCPYFNDYVLHRGYCYGFDGNMLVCIDSHTGKVRWKGGHYGGQVLLVENSNVLIVLTEKGKLVLVRAEPSQFERIAEFQAIKGKTWNHPVLANGKLFVRNAREAACYELGPA